jgi:peptidoglycan hydrolase-like protein with peptidoglycan-binding domain
MDMSTRPNHRNAKAGSVSVAIGPSRRTPGRSARPLRVDRSTVEWAQRILGRAGGEELTPDGLLGENTRNALIRFQARHGLTPCGNIDRATHTALLQLALEWLQQAPLFSVKGTLDEQTAEELRRYQQRVGLKPDGKFGQYTRRAMLRALSSSNSTGSKPEPVPPPPAPLPPTTGMGEPKDSPVPTGFRMEAKKRGLIRYSGERLDRTLDRLRKSKVIELADDDLDTLQRIANIETRGGIQGINTWDSAVVSTGFMQWTLQHGKVQQWIAAAPEAFARHGIKLDPACQYCWGKDTQTGIKEVSDMNLLRWGAWAERFFQVGLDEEALVAEVAFAKKYLKRHLDGLRRRLASKKISQDLYKVFRRHYEASLTIRGMFQAAYNNLPDAATEAVYLALQAAQPEDDTPSFESHLAQGIRTSFSARKKSQRGRNLTTKTLHGARL